MANLECLDCSYVFPSSVADSNPTNCPICDSKNLRLFLILTDQLTFHEKLKGKIKGIGIRKPTREFIYGDEKFKAQNKWVLKKRVIDRENNRYEETVTDPETGSVIHHCDEPLDQHWGHGSAKDKK